MDEGSIVRKIQDGDERLREQFIVDYRPFVIKTISRFCGKFIELENADEYSVGLIAFNEAINGYDPVKGSGFISFAGQVIRRRLIDHTRKNKNHDKVYPFTYFNEDEEGMFDEMETDSLSQKEFEKVEVSYEINSFQKNLGGYGITLGDLVSCAPKHWDSKIMCIGIARQIIKNPNILERLEKTKNIPMNELLKSVDVYRGTVAKHRKYIIALCLVMNSEHETMKSYIMDTEKGGRLNA